MEGVGDLTVSGETSPALHFVPEVRRSCGVTTHNSRRGCQSAYCFSTNSSVRVSQMLSATLANHGFDRRRTPSLEL